MTKRLAQQVIKVRDYGDDWINRLAVICDRFERMENDIERNATLNFIITNIAQPSPKRRAGNERRQNRSA